MRPISLLLAVGVACAPAVARGDQGGGSYAHVETTGGGFFRDLAGELLVTGSANLVTAGVLLYQSTRSFSQCSDQAPYGAEQCELSDDDKGAMKTSLYLGGSSAAILGASWLLFRFTSPAERRTVYRDHPPDGSPRLALVKDLPWTKYTLFAGSLAGGLVALSKARSAERALQDPDAGRTREETGALLTDMRTARASATGLLLLAGAMGTTAFIDTWRAIGDYRAVTSMTVGPTEGGMSVSLGGVF